MAWPTLARLIKIQIRCLENAQILPRDHKLMFLAGLNFDTYSKGKFESEQRGIDPLFTAVNSCCM